MAPHRNMVPSRRRPLRLALGLAVAVAVLVSVSVVLRTPDVRSSVLRTLDAHSSLLRTPNSFIRRRLSSVPLTDDFAFDGTTSDIAQQLYRRHLAGDSGDKIHVTHSDLPARIQNRLDPLGLRFDDLPALLQRALVWDSGYSLDPDLDSSLVKMYTVGGVPMSEIAIPLGGFLGTGCTSRNCSDPNGQATYRSNNCTGDQIRPALRCASEYVKFVQTHTAMWATGGNNAMVPEITAMRHFWKDPVNQTDYTIFAVHTLRNEQEPAWEHCTSAGNYGSLIVPCDVYRKDTAAQNNWVEPRFGAIVTPWLEEVKANQKRHKVLLFIVLPLGLAAVILIIAFSAWYCHRRHVAAGKPGCCVRLCGSTPGPYKDIWGRSLQHTLLSPSPPGTAGAGGSGGSGGGEVLSGEALRALSALPPSEGDAELLRKKLPRRSSSSVMTVTSDVTSMASWDRMTQVLLNDHNLYNKRVALERIQFHKQLSKGGFGEVWLAELDAHPIAVKRMLQSHRVRIEDVEAFVDEIQITASLHHANIPRFLGVAWTTLDRICMVMEYMPGGDLQSFLKRQGHLLTWPDQKRVLAMGIAKALQYLHSRAPVMIHRDIKSRNILVRDQPLAAKVTDFGVSRSVQRDCMTLGVGTPYWTAPEVLGGTSYTEKSDIYSFGVVLSEIDTCQSPYHDLQYGSSDTGVHLQPFHILKEVMAGTMQPKFGETCPPQLRELALKCLDVEPSARPTARDVVKALEQMTWE